MSINSVGFSFGYRIYFGKDGDKVIILLIGGDKGSQTRDITRAQRYWLDYKGQKDDTKKKKL